MHVFYVWYVYVCVVCVYLHIVYVACLCVWCVCGVMNRTSTGGDCPVQEIKNTGVLREKDAVWPSR